MNVTNSSSCISNFNSVTSDKYKKGSDESRIFYTFISLSFFTGLSGIVSGCYVYKTILLGKNRTAIVLVTLQILHAFITLSIASIDTIILIF